MNKYGHRTMNWFEAIVNKIGGEEAADAFLRGELVVSRPTRVWKTWMTIKLGTGLKTADDFCKALTADGYFIGNWSEDILGKPAFKVSKTEQEVELIEVSVRELGFKENTCYEDIRKRASEFGLDLCPAEVGPQLRLQYKDQSKGIEVVVAMNAITSSDGDPRTFSVSRNNVGDQYLDAIYSYDDIIWSIDDLFVFMRRKITQN